ncbi:hypothetical protein CHS0354_028779 [Potamilus streckersoni]|uniref:LIM zinc-binding domain-containing protein n=1 Tax=Potamilus streckersoni TaxID=2493646 RepID=A0AAE0VRJ9_9BIVA|nr:hypothetical protein CHS0354_028779 [Potamilus streckersoni]
MPFKPPDQAKCPKCGKSVYAAEERIAAGKKWHKFCFKCGLCNKLLDSTNSTEHEGELYCKVCHGRKYGPKGYGFGSGAGTLSMDTGEQFGNTEAEMSNRPTEVVIGAGSASGTGVKCPRCGKTVYEAERAIGLTDAWHKSCCNCKICHKSIDVTTLSNHEGEIYCKPCYSKNFGPKGYGFGAGAGALHNP